MAISHSIYTSLIMVLKIKRIWTLFGEAMRSLERDYTKGSLRRALFFLAVPMVVEIFLESVFALVDIYFVGKISTDAVAVVGLTESVLSLVYAISIGLGMSVSAMISRRIGEKSLFRASVAAVQAMLLGLAVSVFLGVVGYFFAEDILRLMGATDSMIKQCLGFTRITFLGNFSVVFLFLLNGIFRGAGFPVIAMKSLWLANALNIFLDPIFIFGFAFIPSFGVEGAAIATLIGRSAGVLYQVLILWKGISAIKIEKQVLFVHWKIIKTLGRVSLGGVGQYLINSASWIFLAGLIARFGAEVMAGYTIAIRLIIFAVLPSWGIANAASTMVGQNLGAGKPERAERSVWIAAMYNFIFMLFISSAMIYFSYPLALMFTGVSTVAFYASKALQILSFGYVFLAFGMVISMAFNGAGDTKTPTIINFICFWLIQIPMAYYFVHFTSFGVEAIYFCILVVEILVAVMLTMWFRRGFWKVAHV